MRMVCRILSILVVLSVALPIASAQESRESRRQRDNSIQTQSERSVSIPSAKEHVIDVPLDPSGYIVGMGDVLEVSIDATPPIIAEVMVSGEGAIVLPFVGESIIGGMTLEEARKTLKKKIEDSYRLSRVSIGLIRPRRIKVRVEGSALYAGSYEFPASARVSTVLNDPLVRREKRRVGPMEIVREDDLVPYASRSILLRRLDGTIREVDLVRFRAYGESGANPHLKEGDEIIVHTFDERIPTMAIGGAIWMEGRFEFRDGDRLIDLVKFGRGIRSNGLSDSVIVNRQGEESRRLSLSAPDTAFPLQPGDRVWIPFASTVARAEVVGVHGEVEHPGVYPVEPGVTRLSDVLMMAGGFTDRALVSGSMLLREFIGGASSPSDRLLALRGNTAWEDSQYVRQEFDLRIQGERVQADFRQAVTSPGGDDDPFVYGGDNIYVPQSTNTIYVFGQVISPGHYPYVSGMTASEYITLAGGYTDQAKDDEMVVIKRSTRQWLNPDLARIEEGDAVWVPKEVDMGTLYELSSYAQIGSVLGSLATVILIITQLVR